MDIKSRSSKTRSKRKSSGRRNIAPSRSPRLDEMVFRTSWTKASVTSGTTGTMSSWTSPSIVNSSEYTVLQNLFTEIKLLKAHFIFTPTQSANGTVNHGLMVVSTNLLLNENTGTAPSGYIDVQNQSHPMRLSTLNVRPSTYKMAVPRNLEFANLVGDAPNPPTPWAGSPGIIRWYSDAGTASTVYFNLIVECVYHLRGRQ